MFICSFYYLLFIIIFLLNIVEIGLVSLYFNGGSEKELRAYVNELRPTNKILVKSLIEKRKEAVW